MKAIIPCQHYSCLDIWKKLVSEKNSIIPDEIVDNIFGLKYYYGVYNRLIREQTNKEIINQKLGVHEKRIKAHIKQLDNYITIGEVINR